jgi:hypothetical protein
VIDGNAAIYTRAEASASVVAFPVLLTIETEWLLVG